MEPGGRDRVGVDASFDLYAALVRRILSVPTGLVTLVEADRQVFLGALGLPEPHQEVRESPLSHSFSRYVVEHSAPFIVTDARLDERVSDHPAVCEISLVAYAGWPLTDHTGQVIGALCAIDVEPRPWTPTELADLADLAQACSAELSQRGLVARLATTNDELQRSNTQLTAFAAQVSHDLRNPLSALSSSLQMLDETRAGAGLDGDLADRLLMRARNSAARMADLVTSVLAFAVVDGQLSVEDVDVAAVVASVLEDLAVDRVGTVVEVGELAAVRADPEQVRVVVQNLVANALKHGAGAPVSVSATSTPDAWTLRVADHGPGIDAADRALVLEPFVRLDTRVPGSGLGLATCRRIAEVHHGRIDVDETPGGGTTVSLRLRTGR